MLLDTEKILELTPAKAIEMPQFLPGLSTPPCQTPLPKLHSWLTRPTLNLTCLMFRFMQETSTSCSQNIDHFSFTLSNCNKWLEGRNTQLTIFVLPHTVSDLKSAHYMDSCLARASRDNVWDHNQYKTSTFQGINFVSNHTEF